MEHPARYALVELVNVYDEGLPFHPIHRVLFGADEGELLEAMKGSGKVGIERMASAEAAIAAVDGQKLGDDVAHRIAVMSAKGALVATFAEPKAKLAAGTVQAFLDPFLEARKGATIDYIPRHREPRRPRHQEGEPGALPSAHRQVELLRHGGSRRRDAPEDLLHGRSPGEEILHRGEEDHSLSDTGAAMGKGPP